MENIINNLTDIHRDALKEIGNIGAGNAATAFAQFLDTKIDMTAPSVSIVPMAEVPEVTGGIERKVVGVLLKVMGEAPSTILLVLSESSVEHLLKMVSFKNVDINNIDEVEISAMKEIGNILSGSYLNAINQMTNLTLVQSVPAFAYDMAGAILSSSMISLSSESDYALMIETQFMNDGKEIEAYFFLMPYPGSLEKILNSLGFNTQ
ncbi:MAG: chemotaxis protein CheC [Bacillota bacterium]